MKQITQPRRIGSIPNATALAHFLTTTPTLFEKGLFVIVAHPTDRRILATSLPYLNHEKKAPSVLEWNGQIHLLPQLLQYDIVIADAKTIETALLPAPSILERQTLRFATDEIIPLAELREKLTDMGFERDETASRPATFALRGDILDIHTDRPYRVSFFGDTIEHVSVLTEADLSVAQQIDTPVLVAPQNARGRSNFSEYIPAFRTVLLFDTDLPETALSTHEPQHIIYANILPSADAPKMPAENAPYTLPKSYHLRRDDLLRDIHAANEVVFFTAEAGALTQFITHEETTLAPHIHVHELDTIGRGFASLHSENQLLCLTDADIGFVEQRQKKASKKLQRALMQQLRPGDYVVHVHHGIARFGGITMQTINDIDREYFVLEYAGRDKIYVPVELADRIDKYIGGENPELQKLSGASWNTALVAVQEDVAKVAQELLDVYARRTTATAHHMLPQKEEQHLDNACPYDLTVDQQDALQNIFDDMMKDQPMDRLLCGDVGFGKTEVALRAAYRAVLNGYQVAVLAPTTILTQQHFDTFTERFKDLGVSVGALSRFQSAAEQKVTIAQIAAGSVDVVVGTHRIFSADVQFKKLGFIVIDEEQRFGVKAKETLTSLRSSAHVLTMTATPIPRTLHLSLSGVRAISTILTPPAARKAVELSIVPLNTEVIVEAVARERARGGQVYYVYNRVQSIERRKLELQALLGEDVRISVAHGQMPPKALSEVMHAFDTGQIDVLLASSIVENGLDVASANTMIVENAAMFGLAELYQLKGRVGRARQQGYAYFLYKEQQLAGDVKERFLALQAASGLGDGFELAMRDMEIRGVGNMLGKAQHGHASKIGLHLYVRLLNTAVQQLQGKNLEPIREVNIDLPLEGRIPEDLIPDTAERIQLYQQLANCTDLTELADAQKDLMKYELLWDGDVLIPEIAGLMQLLEMKILASRSNLVSISTDYPTASNRLASERITITTSEPLPDLPPEWERIYERSHMAFKARASLDQLGDDWLTKLKEIITLCTL